MVISYGYVKPSINGPSITIIYIYTPHVLILTFSRQCHSLESLTSEDDPLLHLIPKAWVEPPQFCLFVKKPF